MAEKTVMWGQKRKTHVERASATWCGWHTNPEVMGDRTSRASKAALEVCFPSVIHGGPPEGHQVEAGVEADELGFQGS